jgi:hypothetical protein
VPEVSAVVRVVFNIGKTSVGTKDQTIKNLLLKRQRLFGIDYPQFEILKPYIGENLRGVRSNQIHKVNAVKFHTNTRTKFKLRDTRDK